MKLKMPCKLCEVSLDHSKMGLHNCTHNLPYNPQQPSFLTPPFVNMPSLPFPNQTFLRDIMLAAYLFRGYYQPAGPLINVPQHAHPQPPPPPPQPVVKSVPLPEPPSSPVSPRPIQSQSSATDSLDSDVIITSVTNAKETQQTHPTQPPPPPQTYRYAPYPPTHSPYGYSFGPQYYPAPHSSSSYHHDLCYSPSTYLHHKAYPPHAYRRHLVPPTSNQYYPTEVYRTPPPTANHQNQPAVTANPNSAYQSTQNGPPHQLVESYPPPPTLVEPYPSPHYYPGYGPPSCYSHSPASRAIPYLDAAYQTCPCPIEPCPKNVHTGPLTGDSKRSGHIMSLVKESLPLPPVALALPLEPISATGPPSPARGSAGMPPPPSPAGATYQPTPPAPKHDDVECLETQPIEKRQARVGKSMVRNNIAANFQKNSMLLMCNPPQNTYIPNVKREIESPENQTVKSVTESDNAVSSQTSSSIDSTIEESSTPIIENKLLDNKEETTEAVPSKTESQEEVVEELLPCQKTVAENVKVKNMKRKLSETKELEKVEASVPSKVQKLDNGKAGGSYKNLIKKNVTSIKINNGKRKLIGDQVGVRNKSSLKMKKLTLKRKINMLKDDMPLKRLKISRPLAASNLHNSKQNCKSIKSKFCNNLELHKKSLVGSCKHKGNTINNNHIIKKMAPDVLDNLIAKNNVDRTIEYVVNGYSESQTIEKSEDVTSSVVNNPKGVETNSNLKQQKVEASKNTISKTEASKSTISKTEAGKSTISKTEDTKAKTPVTENVKTKSPVTEDKTKLSVIEEVKTKPLVAEEVKTKSVTKHVGAKKRKSRNSSTSSSASSTVSKVPKKSLQFPKWSNGWTWKGEPFEGKVFLDSDDNTAIRKCYPAMIHTEGDVIEPRDCVLLKAGPRKNDLPFVAKVASLWENPDDGEMMISLLWYYRPEHTEQGRQPYNAVDEVFASRHKDTNSVACIEDKCYVLTFNEYCRYRKALKRLEVGLEDSGSCIPMPEPYHRQARLPPAHMQTPFDLIFFCQKVYDFRQKRIIKNPS